MFGGGRISGGKGERKDRQLGRWQADIDAVPPGDPLEGSGGSSYLC